MTDLPRRQATCVAVVAQPSRAAKVAPESSASGRVGPPSRHPLSAMARANRPAAAGEAMLSHTLAAPADSPNSVTSRGLPPKARAFRCTQRSAACWSMRP